MRSSRIRHLFACSGLAVLAMAFAVGTPTSAQAAPAPRTVAVEVVPNYAGVHFSIDGNSGVTQPGGVATINDPNLSSAASDVMVPQNQMLSSNLRVSLDRHLSDSNHGAFSRKIILELDVDRAVSMHLLTPQRKVLPVSQVSSVTLSNSLGSTITLNRAQLRSPVWLPASRPSPVRGGVADHDVAYSVKSAIISGTNAVNSGQLRFDTRQSLNWNIPLILHSLTIVGNDLMAARPAGSSVQLTYPNGTVRVVPFGPDHRVTLTELPRGSYGVKVKGGLLALGSTIRLSKDQTSTEIVVTLGDVAEIIAILLVVASVIVAAGVIGRRRRAARRAGEAELGGPESTGGVGGAALV